MSNEQQFDLFALVLATRAAGAYRAAAPASVPSDDVLELRRARARRCG
jgi:hypothetical protein